MQILILLALSGILAAIFATQNATNVPINLLGYSMSNVPLYLVVSGSLLIGLLLSSVISLVTSISTSFRIHGKDAKIKETNKTVADLTKKNRELELTIVKLNEHARHIS